MEITLITLVNDVQVEATIIGQLALHDNNDDVMSVIVTHVKSGCAVAEFSDFTDACDFATKADVLMDFDGYAQALATSPSKRRAAMHFKEQIDAVHKLRDSYVTFMRDQLSRRPDATRKQLTRRVLA